jgi:hypothetical protein
MRCCGSGSGLDLDSMGFLDPDPDSGGQIMAHKNRKKLVKLIIFEVLDVPFRGLKTSPVSATFFWRPRDK